MGRAIGLFLLVVGLGLAAYGLPASDTTWTVGSTANSTSRPAGPAAGSEGRQAAGRAMERSGSLPRDTTGRSTNSQLPTTSGTSASKASSGSNGGISAGISAGMAPMDKLRAAAATRNPPASPEPVVREAVGSMRPMSQHGGLENLPPIPKPVAVQTTPRPHLPVPSVIAKARREATQPAAEATAPKGVVASRAGWSTTVAAPPAGTASPRGTDRAVAATVLSPTRTTTLSLMGTHAGPHAGGAKPDMPPAREIAVREVATSEAARTLRGATEGRSPSSGADAAGASTIAEMPAAKPQPGVRTRVAQRYSPPVYLGRAPSYVPTYSSSRTVVPSRKFRIQEFWENSQRNGS